MTTIPIATVSYPDNGPCIAGYYCPQGTTAMIPCPAGTIRNNTGLHTGWGGGRSRKTDTERGRERESVCVCVCVCVCDCVCVCV